MALSFNPPEWLLQEYFNRKQPAEIANEGIGNAIKTYAEADQQKKLMALKQQEMDQNRLGTYIKAFEAGGPDFAQNIATQIGLKNPPALPGRTSVQVAPGGTAGVTPQPQTPQPNVMNGFQMTPNEMNAQQSIPGEHIIDHWNQTMGTAPSAQPNAGLIGLPQDINQQFDKFGGMGKYGEKQRANLMAQVTMAKGLKDLNEDPNAPVPTMTKEDALKAGSVNPRAKILEPSTRSEEADLRHQDRMAKAVTDFGKQIETHPVIKTLMAQDVGINQVEELAHLVNEGNSVAAAGMGIKMAKAMGEVGVMTEQDIKRYIQSGKLTQGAGDTLHKWMTGTPSKATMQEISQISGALRDSFGSKIQPIYDRHIERFARAYKITPEEASYQLALPYKSNSSKKSNGGGSGDPLGIR